VSILGQTPLASLAGRFGTLADTLGALQAQVATLHDNLADNQANLVALGASLSDVAVQLRQVDAILGSGEIQDSLGTTIAVIRWLMALLAVMFAVPAVAALAFGLWLRRQIAAGSPAADPTA
jgi:phage-related minor tail protein